MATGTVRVEIHPPGSTLDRRGPAPIASASFTISGTTPTDPTALPTVASLVPGGFTGPCLVFVTPDIIQPFDRVWCAIGKVPDITKEPRHLLSGDNTGRVRTFIFEIGNNDRVQIGGVS